MLADSRKAAGNLHCKLISLPGHVVRVEVVLGARNLVSCCVHVTLLQQLAARHGREPVTSEAQSQWQQQQQKKNQPSAAKP
jgi:hypothetical protein